MNNAKVAWMVLWAVVMSGFLGEGSAFDGGGSFVADNVDIYESAMAFEGGASPNVGKIKVGALTVIAGFSVQEEYNDNIYLTNGDSNGSGSKESDWITHLQPSVLLKYDMMKRGSLSLGYAGDFALYGSNNDNDWDSQRIFFNGDYKAPVGFIFGISNNFVDSDDPYANDNQYRLGEKSKRWYDDLQVKTGYEFAEKYRLMMFYNFYKQEYDLEVDDNQDYNNNEFGLGAEMRILTQTWMFLRYHTGARDYTSHSASVPDFSDANDADFSWDRVNIGLNWDATAKISGELNVGYQWNRADNAVDPYGDPYDDKDTWIAATRVNYQLSPKTRLSAELFRALEYSGADLSDFFDETGFALSLNQKVMAKGVVRAGAGYALHDYYQPVGNERTDDNYKATLGFDYYIRQWLKTGLEYRYWQRESNNDYYDFTENRYMITVGVVY